MPTKFPRISITVTPEEHADLVVRAGRTGLSVSEYLLACAEQVARPHFGLHSRLVDKDNRVDVDARGPHGVHRVKALVVYKRQPRTLTLESDSRPARCRYTPRGQWIPYARVGDVAVWETRGPFRVGVVGLDTLEPFTWCDTPHAALEAVVRLLRENGR